jgi:hypothetical protein
MKHKKVKFDIKWIIVPIMILHFGLCCQSNVYSKTYPSYLDDNNPVDSVFQALKEIKWNGYIRTYFYGRNLQDKYFDTPGGNQWYSVGAGWGQPLMRLTGRGQLYKNTGFEIEYTLNSLLYGQDDNNSLIRNAVPLQTLKFQTNYNTNYGKFKFTGGGVLWCNQTTFTLGGFKTRYDSFERVPWEGPGSSLARYNKAFSATHVDEARDSRFGSAAIQGVILEGADLPHGLGFSAIIGKSNFSGGYQSWQKQSPKKIQSYRLYKRFGQNTIGINYNNSFGETDQYLKKQESTNIITTDINLNVGNFTINSEIGMGTYSNPKFSPKSGEAINLIVSNNKNFINAPFTVQFFQVNPNVVNPNSEMQNSSVGSLSQSFGDSTQLNTKKGGIFDIGQVTNNRRALDIIINKTIGNFKIGIGASSGQELQNLYNEITFQHRLNRMTRAQFNFYQSRVGPYDRIYSVFLTTFEAIKITNPGNTATYRKGFNIVDFTLKYKMWLFNRQLIFTNYINYNTVQKGLSALPVNTDKAFVTYVFDEFITIYEITSKVCFIGLVGKERVIGNNDTETAPNGKHVNQFGYAYGAGIDIDINDRAGLYIRHRWFSHRDPNFVLDKFKGQETGIEFKVFF